jgi:hypothetical protein
MKIIAELALQNQQWTGEGRKIIRRLIADC